MSLSQISQKKKIVLTLGTLGALVAMALVGTGGISGLRSEAINSPDFVCTTESLGANTAKYNESSTQITELENELKSLPNEIKGWEKDLVEIKKRTGRVTAEVKQIKKDSRQLEIYVQKSCIKPGKTAGRNGVSTALPEDCPEKQSELQVIQENIKSLQASLVEMKNTSTEIKKKITTGTQKKREITKNLSALRAFVEDYATCQNILSGNDRNTPETGGDLPVYNPETGGDLPQATDTPTDTPTNTPPPATTSTPMTDTILVDATIDTFDKLRIESYKLSTSYNINMAFSEDKLNEIAGRFDILSATLVALKEGTSEGGNTTSTDWDSVLNSLYAQRNSIEAVEETALRKQQLTSLINNYKALKKKSKNTTSIEVSTRVSGVGVVKINSDNDIAKVNNLIRDQEQIIIQKNQQLGAINTQIQQATTAQAGQKTSTEEREKILKESATQIEQVEMYLSKVRSLVESFRTGKDNETTCTIQADWKPLDNALVELSKATLNKFAPGRTNLEHLTEKKPISSSLVSRAEEAYTEIKNVLVDLENEVSRYESQDNTYGDSAPVECLQWWNAEKQKRNSLASSNGKLAMFKPQIVEFRRFITWMDQNHFTGNN